MQKRINIGDRVRHKMTGAVATVTGVRKLIWLNYEGPVPAFRLDFGRSVLGPFRIEMNGKEFRKEALEAV